MNAKRIYAVFLRYMILLRASPQRLFQIFIWGALDVVLWGFITKYLVQAGGSTFSFVPMLLGAVILLDFSARAHHGTSTPALEDIWSNNLFNYFASPLKITEYISGLVLSSIITAALALIVALVIAKLAFGFAFDLTPPLLGYLAILFTFGIAVGIFGVSIVLRFGPSGEWYVWPMTALISPFIGVFYPLSVLPAWMQTISYALPPSYVFEGMRAILLRGEFDTSAILIGLAFAVLYVAAAHLFFLRIYKSVVRSGLLARHSAEGI